jgi:hypothetical protein
VADTQSLIPSALVAKLSPEFKNKLQQISQDCTNKNKTICFRHFERYYRGNQDHSKKGGFLGIFGAEHFWGAAEELHYTQIEAKEANVTYEYQVGFGYQIAARQANATMNGTGLVLERFPQALNREGFLRR